MMLHAKPNLNGNDRKDFSDAYMALYDAKAAVEAAGRKLMADVAHGRNYQHLTPSYADDMVIADRHRIHVTMMKVNGLLGQLQSDLADILLGDE